MKSKIQRWTCKKLVACCVGKLWDWVRQGDVTLRLACFRKLGDFGDDEITLPSNEKATSLDSLVTECRTLIVETLMMYAQGTGSDVYQEFWKDELEAKRIKRGSPEKKLRQGLSLWTGGGENHRLLSRNSVPVLRKHTCMHVYFFGRGQRNVA